MEDPIKMLRRSLKANAVLEQRQKLLQAEVVDLQLALVERGQPGSVADLAAQVARLKADNATLSCKLKRSRLAAKEAIAGLSEALSTERALRKAAEAKLLQLQDQDSDTLLELSTTDEDDRHIWHFPADIAFPISPSSSINNNAQKPENSISAAGLTTALHTSDTAARDKPQERRASPRSRRMPHRQQEPSAESALHDVS